MGGTALGNPGFALHTQYGVRGTPRYWKDLPGGETPLKGFGGVGTSHHTQFGERVKN